MKYLFILLTIGLFLVVLFSGCVSDKSYEFSNSNNNQQNINNNQSCVPNWSCNEWSNCSSFNTQARNCNDLSNCNVSTNKPIESKSCIYTIKEPEPILISGAGQKATEKFNLESGISLFDLNYLGTGHFSAVLYKDDGDYIDLLANTIGTFNGSKVVVVDNSGNYLLDISSSGTWNINITQPRPTTGIKTPLTLTGTGQKASKFFYLNNGLSIFKLKHNGKSHFSAVLYSLNGEYIELLANVIGKFDGSKAVAISNSELYILDISADGDWEINVD